MAGKRFFSATLLVSMSLLTQGCLEDGVRFSAKSSLSTKDQTGENGDGCPTPLGNDGLTGSPGYSEGYAGDEISNVALADDGIGTAPTEIVVDPYPGQLIEAPAPGVPSPIDEKCFAVGGGGEPVDAGPLGNPIFRRPGKSDKIEPLSFAADAMQLRVSVGQKVADKQVNLHRFNVDLTNGQVKVTGQVTPYFEPPTGNASSQPIGISVGDIKSCEVTDTLSAAELTSLKSLITALKICRPELPNSDFAIPALALSPDSADLIFSKGTERLYLSWSWVYLSQYPDAKSVCESAPELEKFFVDRITTALYTRCNDAAN